MKQLLSYLFLLLIPALSFAKGDRKPLSNQVFNNWTADSSYFKHILVEDATNSQIKGHQAYTAISITRPDTLVTEDGNAFFRHLIDDNISIKSALSDDTLFVQVTDFYNQIDSKGYLSYCVLECYSLSNGRYHYINTLIPYSGGSGLVIDKSFNQKVGNQLFIDAIFKIITTPVTSLSEETVTYDELVRRRDNLEQAFNQFNLSDYPKGVYSSLDSFLNKKPFITDFTSKNFGTDPDYDFKFSSPNQKINGKQVKLFTDGKNLFYHSYSKYFKVQADGTGLYTYSIMKDEQLVQSDLERWTGQTPGTQKIEIRYKTRFHPLLKRFYPYRFVRLERVIPEKLF